MTAAHPPSYWTPRDSVRMRLAREGEDQGLTAEALVVEDFSTRFPQALAQEAQAVLDGLAEELARLDAPGLPRLGVTLDSQDWSVNGLARLLDDGSAALSISLGFVLALEEAILTFLATADAICPVQLLVDEDEVCPQPQAYDCDEVLGACRYFDYRHLQGRAFTADAVTVSFPADLWRLRQADLLFRLVLRWAALHEIAHAALRHNELLAICYPQAGPGLGLVEGLPLELALDFDPRAWERFSYPQAPELAPRESDLRRVCELHADTCALWLSLDLEAFGGGGLFETFAQDMARLVETPQAHYASFNRNERVYLLTLAATMAQVLFENARRQMGGGDATHPTPEARIISLMDAAFYGSPFTEPDDQGGFRIVIPAADLWNREEVTPWNRFVQEALAPVIDDMAFFADVIDLDFALLTNDPDEPEDIPIERFGQTPFFKPVQGLDNAKGRPWWRDLLARQHAAMAGQDPPPAVSDGGRDLIEVDPFHPHVGYMSEILQIQLNGAMLTFSARSKKAAGA